MFTGLVDHVGRIKNITPLPTGIQLRIATQFADLREGESIAIDGACLTVTTAENNAFIVQLSKETLDCTIARDYCVDTKINLERALKIGDSLGGHFVSGHIDQTAKIADIIPHHEFTHYVIEGFTQEQQNYLIYKGSIAINGVSLTINKIENNCCHVLLIPHTLQLTNLATLTINDKVNIEFDLLAKLVARQLQGIQHAQTV